MNLLRRISVVVRWFLRADRPPGHYERDLGKRGEDEAARHLKSKGYRILERNFRWTGGEIDLAAFKDGVVVFVEVRARTEPVGLEPLSTITRAKQRKLIRTAHRYIATRHLDQQDVALRFDVVTVRYQKPGAGAKVEHIVDAFQA